MDAYKAFLYFTSNFYVFARVTCVFYVSEQPRKNDKCLDFYAHLTNQFFNFYFQQTELYIT